MKTTKLKPKIRTSINIQHKRIGWDDAKWAKLCSDIDRLANISGMRKERCVAELLEDGVRVAFEAMEGIK